MESTINASYDSRILPILTTMHMESSKLGEALEDDCLVHSETTDWKLKCSKAPTDDPPEALKTVSGNTESWKERADST